MLLATLSQLIAKQLHSSPRDKEVGRRSLGVYIELLEMVVGLDILGREDDNVAGLPFIV